MAARADRAYADLMALRQRKIFVENFKHCFKECIAATTNLLEYLTNKVSGKLEDLKRRVASIKISTVTTPSPAAPALEVRNTLKELVSDVQEIRSTLDVVDNRTRMQNVIVHGFQGQDAHQAVELLSKAEPQNTSTIDTAFFIGENAWDNKRPLLLRFRTVGARDNFLKVSREVRFKSTCPGITAAPDESLLRRKGASRLAACAPALQNQFPGIHILSRAVQLGNQKIQCSSFAANSVRIGTGRFTIDSVVEQSCKNPQSCLAPQEEATLPRSWVEDEWHQAKDKDGIQRTLK